MLIDRQGRIVQEWNESTGDLSKFYVPALLHTSKGIYLIAGGNDSNGKQLTVMKKINVPSAGKPDNDGTVMQLTIKDMDSWTVAQRPQIERYRGLSDKDIEQLIAKWSDEYKDTDFWNLEKRAQEDPQIHGIPSEYMGTHIGAIQILLKYIQRMYSDMTLDDLKDYRPHIAYRIDLGAPQWQITLMSPDAQGQSFTGYIYAETGEIVDIIYVTYA